MPTSAPDNNNNGALPYDEFGLGANEPNQPHVGSVGPGTERAAAGLDVPVSVLDANNNNGSLPYDEFGLGANQPNKPGLVAAACKLDAGEPHNVARLSALRGVASAPLFITAVGALLAGYLIPHVAANTEDQARRHLF